ncbi:hypothetical protein DPEC_G00052400 [Dallia pectoralis]|uniref:Uncharacterized protein n=1 Tax=Dallia pectoralis TaxID=75939 RepID=A0ACC2HCC7_DALPE|nr:hypothetical protein DPEC_G00052400 [Dallia pectoralis]
MNSEKPSFLTQPVVKNIFVYRNGDPFYEARRLVVNQKRVSNFDNFLREVTGGVQARFGAVRNIYTPRMGHRVACLDHLQSGEQYVAAGREKFKKIDYSQIGSKKKRMLQRNSVQDKTPPRRRIIASARFLKPIKEPCTIFVVANGDVMNPALRILLPQRILSQYDRVLEMITDKMEQRILGGVRSLYTFNGNQLTNGHELENGQFYVAVGRDKLRRLPYSDLQFAKPRGSRRIITSKASSLPPIYGYGKLNGNANTSDYSSSMVLNNKPTKTSSCDTEHVASIVREISQQRLMILRNKRSCISISVATQDNDVDCEQKDEAESAEENDDTSPWIDQLTKDRTTEEERGSDSENNREGNRENKESIVAENSTEEPSPRSIEEAPDPLENQESAEQAEEAPDPLENQESAKQAEEAPDPLENQESVDQAEEVPDPLENQESVDQAEEVPDPLENQEYVDQAEETSGLLQNQESAEQAEEDSPDPLENKESVDQAAEVPDPFENQGSVNQAEEAPDPLENQESVNQAEEASEGANNGEDGETNESGNDKMHSDTEEKDVDDIVEKENTDKDEGDYGEGTEDERGEETGETGGERGEEIGVERGEETGETGGEVNRLHDKPDEEQSFAS